LKRSNNKKEGKELIWRKAFLPSHSPPRGAQVEPGKTFKELMENNPFNKELRRISFEEGWEKLGPTP